MLSLQHASRGMNKVDEARGGHREGEAQGITSLLRSREDSPMDLHTGSGNLTLHVLKMEEGRMKWIVVSSQPDLAATCCNIYACQCCKPYRVALPLAWIQHLSSSDCVSGVPSMQLHTMPWLAIHRRH